MHNPQLNSIRSHLFSGGFSRHSGQCRKLLTEGVEEEEEGKGKTRSTKTVSYTISCGNDTQRTPTLESDLQFRLNRARVSVWRFKIQTHLTNRFSSSWPLRDKLCCCFFLFLSFSSWGAKFHVWVSPASKAVKAKAVLSFSICSTTPGESALVRIPLSLSPQHYAVGGMKWLCFFELLQTGSFNSCQQTCGASRCTVCRLALREIKPSLFIRLQNEAARRGRSAVKSAGGRGGGRERCSLPLFCQERRLEHRACAADRTSGR